MLLIKVDKHSSLMKNNIRVTYRPSRTLQGVPEAPKGQINTRGRSKNVINKSFYKYVTLSINHWPWTPESWWFFVNLKPIELSKSHRNIICRSSKVVLICIVRMAWLKNQACHAHFSFEIYSSINPSSLQLKPSPSGFKLLRYRAKKVVFIARL